MRIYFLHDYQQKLHMNSKPLFHVSFSNERLWNEKARILISKYQYLSMSFQVKIVQCKKKEIQMLAVSKMKKNYY